MVRRTGMFVEMQREAARRQRQAQQHRLARSNDCVAGA